VRVGLLIALLSASPAWSATGGPDAFGYTYIDSNEPGGPVYVWEDISATGSFLVLGDDDSIAIPMGFDFPFYGRTFDQVSVHSNGLLHFHAPSSTWYGNTCIPANTGYDAQRMIAVHWDDMNPPGGGDVLYQMLGTAPQRRMVITWRLIPLYALSTSLHSFQAVLFETGVIELRYRRVDDNASSATIGIQDTASVGLGYHCSGATVVNSTLVRFADCDSFADADGDGSDACLDCDDNDNARYPGASETCDGVDSDCNGVDGADADGDGYGACGEDCNDNNAAISPGAAEVACSGVDEDCDPATVDGPDGDGDGSNVCDDCDDDDPARSPAFNEIGCNSVDDDCDATTRDRGDNDGDGYSVCGEDCDDSDPDINPMEAEVRCNGVDDDCDEGTFDSVDRDEDGTSACEDCDDLDADVAPGLPDICDEVDNDCDEDVDEDCSAETETDVAVDSEQPEDTDVRGIIGADPNLPFNPLGCSCASSGAVGGWWAVVLLWGLRRRR
jgi:hypothetical protein